MVKGGDICPPALAQAAKAGAQSRLTHAAGAVALSAQRAPDAQCAATAARAAEAEAASLLSSARRGQEPGASAPPEARAVSCGVALPMRPLYFDRAATPSPGEEPIMYGSRSVISRPQPSPWCGVPGCGLWPQRDPACASIDCQSYGRVTDGAVAV